ncbi:sensor histidine kinase [Granulicella arctica]|uniref:Ligand-binding sensor domain-containing protein/signal transduction histidine kinase n=1 Tax=Granulicella arctica TaxID=940613 RepID=A0A7Y9PIU8_9BACT|nr:sensor histidine kinase [Granulicella arctica]NYF80549.1 ligand-binding sensor domain-containing protein/signal transduction histidine kinase [Granulicella arctica]
MSFCLRGVVLGMMVLALGRCGFGLDPSRSLNQYGRQVWGTDNGLPQNTVHAVVQGRDGYVWLGTDDGLVRFDGSAFKVYTTENAPELRSNSVQGLTVDREGRLWVVTAGGLAVYGENRFLALGLADGLPDAAVWFVHEDRRRRVWVATGGGLCVVRGVRCEVVAATKGLSVSGEGKFAEAVDGSVWVADGAEAVRLDGGSLGWVETLKTVGGAEILVESVGSDGALLVGTGEGLQMERRGVLAPVVMDGVVGRVAVNAMVRAADGSVWLGTSGGLVKGSGERFGVFRPAVALPSVAVQTLFADRAGAVWVGTASGVARVVGGRLEVFQAGDGLAGSSLLSLLEDREGNVWLGTESDGLTVLHEQKFTTYTTAEGLSGNVVRSVLEDVSGSVWVGTDGAGLNRRTAEGFAAMTVREGLSSNVILSLASDNGDLWVGTPTGLNRVRGRTVKVLTTADGLADDFIRSLLVDAKGDVWVGTRHGLTRISGNGMTTYTSMDGLGSDFIGVMVQARDGDLWIGTSGGLTRLHEGRFTNFKVRDGVAKNVVTAIYEDADGTLWLGSNGGGLSRMDVHKGNGVIVPVPATNLPEAISSVLEDGERRLWIGSRGGVFRVAESELERVIARGGGSVALAAYDTTDGMRVRECSSGGHPAAMRMRDGTLWFATLRGVSVVDPEHLDENGVAPLVAMETVLVNDVAHDALRTGELTLGPGRQRVEFQYAGMSFVAPQKVRYRYKLEGFDREWVDAGEHRSAFYSNLQPGRYVFHVEAANNDGVWSEQDAVLRLRVRPHFWQTWWFYGVLVLVVAGIAYLIYAWRVRRVEALYAGVMEERSRIAREIHDTLAQGIVSISLQLEVVTRLMGSSVEAARAQLDETRVLVRQSLADARSSIWDLRSEEAEELPVRVGRSLKMLTGTSSATGRLTVMGSYRAIARPVEDELLRITQEAVTNAVRHSGCSLVEVTLTYDLKGVRLVVRDDGRGFDTSAAGPAGHFGLRGMRERAAKIHARLEMRSEVGSGTEIFVELNLG